MQNESVTAVEFIQQTLAALDADLMMSYIFLSNVQEATKQPNFSYGDLAAAALEAKPNDYDLTLRGPDDFSSEPYLWVTPKPQPLEEPIQPPEKFWVIGNPEGTAVLRVKEGLLIFTHPGYAAGYVIKTGMGDFNVHSYQWADLVKEGNYPFVVINYHVGEMMHILPVT